MNKKTSTTFWVIVVIVLVIALIVWLVIESGSSNMTAVESQQASSTLAADLNDATLVATKHVLFGDTFTLTNGQATIAKGHAYNATSTPLIPISYTLAATGFGDVMGDGSGGAISVFYRSFGADIQQLAMFAFKNVNGSLVQVASGIVYTGDSKVQTVVIDKGQITVSMLIVSPADQKNLPHYEQVPNDPVLLKEQISGGTFVQLPQ